jgi:hypothetical protein
VILDLVQDKVRSRVYAVLLTLLIVTSAAYWALAPAFRQSNVLLPPVSVAQVVATVSLLFYFVCFCFLLSNFLFAVFVLYIVFISFLFRFYFVFILFYLFVLFYLFCVIL